jgi:predicted transcriptional regulator
MQLTITLPPDLQEKLISHATSLNVSLESLVLQSLEQTVQQAEQAKTDALVSLFGTINSGLPDLADNHDYYLGKALQEEMRCAE